MPRRPYKKVAVLNDPIYDHYEITKLIHYIMVDGKKKIAQKIVYAVLDALKETKLDPIDVVNAAIVNAAPDMEVKPKRVGGASYLVPMETRSTRRLYLALKGIVNAARARSNKQYHTFAEKLYHELLDAYQKQGGAVEKKQQIEKLAESNKAFAHFKW